jgi:hypothetical protein
MLLFLIFFVLLSAVAAAAVISIFRKSEKSLPPLSQTPPEFQPIQYKSIFAPSDEEIRAFEAEDEAKQREQLRQKILARAEAGDFDALSEAKDFEIELYDRVLTELVLRVDAEKFVALGAFVEAGELPANQALVERFQEVLKTSGVKKDAIRLLHFAALSGRAQVFFDSVEIVVQLSREDRVRDFTQTDLIHLAESQFWLLPPAEKTSGAGFLLKQKLAKLRSEVQEKQ